MIKIKDLSVHFKNVKAVNQLNLEIEQGDAFGFIGPNGAGKTTTIKILATLMHPTYGTANIGGYSVIKEPQKVRKILGYMPDFFGIYDNIKAWEYLDFFARSYRIDPKYRAGVITDVLELTDLTFKRDAYVEELSRGMQQRLCLARALIHNPQVLILDEPASGLDPRARIELKALLKELRKMGKTIFISSHILPELADFCNKIGIIENGKLLVAGSVEEINKRIKPNRVIKLKLKENIEQAKEILESNELVANIKLDVTPKEQVLSFDFAGDDEQLSEITSTLINNKIKLINIYEEETNLEDVFMKITKGIVS